MRHESYEKLFSDAPATAAFGAESATWLATYLGKFDSAKLRDARALATAATRKELREPTKLRDFLGAIWDAVSQELDCSDLSEQQQQELQRLEQHLSHSVHVLRVVVGY